MPMQLLVKAASNFRARLRPSAFKLKNISTAASANHSKSPPPISRSCARLPVELGCVVSMLPLHCAIASSRMVSSLSSGLDSWAVVPQGVSMPL